MSTEGRMVPSPRSTACILIPLTSDQQLRGPHQLPRGQRGLSSRARDPGPTCASLGSLSVPPVTHAGLLGHLKRQLLRPTQNCHTWVPYGNGSSCKTAESIGSVRSHQGSSRDLPQEEGVCGAVARRPRARVPSPTLSLNQVPQAVLSPFVAVSGR